MAQTPDTPLSGDRDLSSPNSPDWAANRRVLFCDGDHADEACEAGTWAVKYFLERDDEITLLR